METALKVKLLFYSGASMALLFTLPYFIGVGATASPSYVFGYNNQAAVLLLLALLGVGVFIAKDFNFQFSTAQSRSFCG
jgi:hypothetical protein